MMHAHMAIDDADIDDKTLPLPPLVFPREEPRSRALPLLLGALAGAVCFAISMLIASVALGRATPRDVLVVTVASEEGRTLPETRVFLDGALRCESSPCRIADVEDGLHFVSASAAGYITSAPRVVRTSQNETLRLHLGLGRF